MLTVTLGTATAAAGDCVAENVVTPSASGAPGMHCQLPTVSTVLVQIGLPAAETVIVAPAFPVPAMTGVLVPSTWLVVGVLIW